MKISYKLSGMAVSVAALCLPSCTTAQMEELQKTVSESFEDSMNASAFGSGSVEVKPDRAPAVNAITVSYAASLLAGASSEAAQCTRALAKACSDSFGGVAAPYCVSTKAELCGVFPQTPGGDAAACFSNVGEGRLSGACRETGLASGVSIAQTSATFPFGPARSVYEQYQVMVAQYKIPAYQATYDRAAGTTKCSGGFTKAGQNLRCQIEFINENMVDAAGQNCAFKYNSSLDFKKSMDAIQEVANKMDHQCSVQPEVLESMFDQQTKNAYAFK